MKKFTLACPFCRNTESFELDDATAMKYGAYKAGELQTTIQKIAPDKPASVRDTMMMGICHECWTKTYHRPYEGYEKDFLRRFGHILGYCECCDCPITETDVLNKHCYSCYEEINPERLKNESYNRITDKNLTLETTDEKAQYLRSVKVYIELCYPELGSDFNDGNVMTEIETAIPEILPNLKKALS